MAPFLIYGLPRSRTAWLARFLSYRDWHCGHDELIHCRGLDDVRAWLSQPNTGTVETAAAPWWRLALKYAPDARVVVVRRPVAQVVDSLRRLGFDDMTPAMECLDRKLDQIEQRVPGAISVRFSDLEDEAVCAGVFEHCLPYAHDPEWWARCDAQNVQVNMQALCRYVAAHQPALDKLAAQATQQVRAGLMARPAVDPDGVTFQVEPFDAFYRDGQALFDEHLVQVGEAPGDHVRKNLPLFRKLDEIGALQCLTARCNGRMFGYLVSVIAPSLESEALTSGVHTTFFASREFPGLGMKLQRAALDLLRERGVGEVVFRAGTRGSGAKMGALYRRLGAEDHGHLYRLALEA